MIYIAGYASELLFMGENYLMMVNNRRYIDDSKALLKLGYLTQGDKASLLKHTLTFLDNKRNDVSNLSRELFRRLKQVYKTDTKEITLTNSEVETIITGKRP